jgi:hypothetical protein
MTPQSPPLQWPFSPAVVQQQHTFPAASAVDEQMKLAAVNKQMELQTGSVMLLSGVEAEWTEYWNGLPSIFGSHYEWRTAEIGEDILKLGMK